MDPAMSQVNLTSSKHPLSYMVLQSLIKGLCHLSPGGQSLRSGPSYSSPFYQSPIHFSNTECTNRQQSEAGSEERELLCV